MGGGDGIGVMVGVGGVVGMACVQPSPKGPGPPKLPSAHTDPLPWFIPQ